MTAALKFLPPPAAEPMVTFAPAAEGRELVMLGVVQIGEISPWHGGVSIWRLWLPSCGPGFRRAPCLDAARDQITDRIEQWVEAAGLRSVHA